MIDVNEMKNSPLGMALSELRQKLETENLPHINLNVIGGFAMMVHGKRNINEYTDIDYVGKDMDERLKNIIDEIGMKHKLGKGWINNDVMLSGISEDDFEFATGELHFLPYYGSDKITINVVSPEDLLRLKLIAIDTSAMACELGGDFSRMKDFPDLISLMESEKIAYADLKNKFDEYIQCPYTISLIKTYTDKGQIGVDEKIKEISDKNILEIKEQRATNNAGPSLMNLMLQNAEMRLHNPNIGILDIPSDDEDFEL